MDNQFLVTLVELGLVGFTALLGLFLTSHLCARGARKRAGALSHQHLGLALSASIAGVFVAYATFDALGFAMVAGLTFLLFGLAGATWQLARGDQVSAVERTAAGPASAPAPLSTEKAVAG
jgi:O-antigen ligase